MPWLLKAEAYDPDAPGVVTRYFSDGGLVTGPADTPAHTYWVRRIDVPPSVVRSAWSGTRVGGRSEAGFGTVTLANLDGALDALAALEWSGHTVEVKYSALPRPVLSDFATVFVAVARHVVVGDVVEFTLAERRDLADVNHQPARFAGDGEEEGGADWTDVRKPRALGICWQVEPEEVDEGNLIFVYSDGSSSGGVMQLRDQGVPIRRGGNHADVAAMLAGSFGSTDFQTVDALGVFQARVAPARPVTADVLGKVTGSNLVSNPGFASDLAGWTAGTGWAHGSARAEKTAGTASDLTQAVTTVAGGWYAIRVSSSRSSGSGALALVAGGDTLVADLSGDFRRVSVFQASGTSTTIGVSADSAWAGAVDDVAVLFLPARAGDLIQRILLDDTPLTSGDIEAADIAALNTAQPAALGLYQRAGVDRPVPEVLDEICATVGAWWGFDPATGKFRVRRLDAPGTPDHTIEQRQVHRITMLPAELRLREQTVEAARRWRPLVDGEVAPAITEATRRSLVTPSYPCVATHADTASAAKLWRDETLASLFAYQEDGQAEAERRAALFGPQRLSAEVEVDDIPSLELGQTVRIVHARYGLAAGRDFRVLRASREGDPRVLTMTLWG